MRDAALGEYPQAIEALIGKIGQLICRSLAQDKLIAFLIIRRGDEANRHIGFALGEFRRDRVIAFLEDLRLGVMHRDVHIGLSAQCWCGEHACRDA